MTHTSVGFLAQELFSEAKHEPEFLVVAEVRKAIIILTCYYRSDHHHHNGYFQTPILKSSKRFTKS